MPRVAPAARRQRAGARGEARAAAPRLRSNLALPGNMPLRTRILSGDMTAEAPLD